MGGWRSILCSPDWDGPMPESCDPHVDVHPERSHQAPNSPHQAEDGHIPHIVKHALPIQRQAVRVEPKVPIPPKVRAQDALRVLLHTHAACLQDSRIATEHGPRLRSDKQLQTESSRGLGSPPAPLPRSMWVGATLGLNDRFAASPQKVSGLQGNEGLCRPTAHSTRKCRVKTPMPVERKPRQKMEVE